ncbi:3-hydroxybutyrate oligomer hydrolase family protein [Chitinimonas sp. BJB300]|uniref:3-hydroxybutyrate oligomer hydrolase family protein n=1 Tax=Chitinimonas sp. BJB300 TaxID=1559339 RepID=UPI000C106DA6|nr:3-hydroxybutyrate oligomer hydrolase family protein [Chitinimonas sp. BJB300]PHV10405.1 D-(-)-3-hydroxybutyrate oligomer hydrolase [Chitinimonas sp. BJB300]TSJ83828.1 D-(-)-3-hydroxybutyrate oligomer hydrolase [Chitinimonas sp. BJB300]
MPLHLHYLKPIGSAALLSIFLLACGGNTSDDRNVKPSWLGDIVSQSYDGNSDDLLTAGLGKTGLAGVRPNFANPAAPTAAELRRDAIYNNYRALVDMTITGGYSRLYGPNIDTSGNDTLGEGKIAGTEYSAFADDGTGRQNVTLMVQIPASFDKANPCVITATSSGSRGMYGAIATAGDWGLKHGCAVAYADKGSGMGVHDLNTDTVNLMDGTRATRAVAGLRANFTAGLSEAELAGFNTAYPNRLAVKHAHSQQNSEKDWGRDTLRVVEFAFYLLNEKYAAPAAAGGKKADYATPASVTVIAASVSNGGGAALAAAELDSKGLIDGVAVGEPQVQPKDMTGISIRQGSTMQASIGKPLIDYITLANLYQPCAVQSARLAGANSAFNTIDTTLAANRCAALAAKGLVTGSTLAAQADAAYDKLIAGGWVAEADALHASHYGLNASLGIAMAYVNAYGRFSVIDNLCGYSYAFTDATGNVVASPAASLAAVFGNGNGVAPMAGISVVNNLSVGGAKADANSISASTNTADYNVDGAICLRKLATGLDSSTGMALTGAEKVQADRVAVGVKAAQRSANLQGKSAIIVTGRADALIPVNHAARAYYALNQKVEGLGSRLSYIEVTHAQHFDSFLGLSGFPTRFVPLHVYAGQALDAMWRHLKTGAALPKSQLVRTTPRTVATDNLTNTNLPGIVANPAAGEAITYSGGVLTLPD